MGTRLPEAIQQSSSVPSDVPSAVPSGALAVDDVEVCGTPSMTTTATLTPSGEDASTDRGVIDPVPTMSSDLDGTTVAFPGRLYWQHICKFVHTKGNH